MTPEQFLQLADLLPEAMLLVGREGLVLAANAAAAEFLGFRRQELRRKPLLEFVANPPEVVLRYLGNCARNRALVPGSLDFRLKSGQVVSCRCDGALMEPLSNISAELLLCLRQETSAVKESHIFNRGSQVEGLANEIEKRERAEEEALWHLAAIVESSDDAIIGKTLDGIIVSWNSGAERIYGYSAEEIKGRSIAILVPPERSDEVPKILARIKRGERIHHDETVHVRKGGERIWVSLTLSPIKDTAGTITGCSTIAHDITAGKQAEAARRESEARARAVVELAIDAMVATDSAGRIISWNKAAERIFQYTEEEVLGQLLTMIMPERYRQDCQEGIKRYQRTGIPHFIGRTTELYGLRKDGREFPVEVSLMAWEAERGQFYHSIIRDITQRKTLEQELALRERSLNSFFTTAPAGLAILDAELRFLRINDTFAQIRGLAAQEHLGKTVHEAMPQLAPVIEPIFRQVLTTGQPILNFETSGETLAQPGVLRHWVGSYFPIMGADGKPINIGVILVEITERKRAEAALRDSQARMAGIIASAMDAIITIDADQYITLFNAAAEKMFRCSATEALGQPLDRFIPERYRHAHREHVRVFGHTNVTKRTMGAMGALFGRRADGEEFPIEASISQVEVGGEKLYTVVLRDITERQRAEQGLRESAERLQGLSRRLMEVQEAERRHLARELHDEIGQALTAVKINLQALRGLPEAPVRPLEESVGIVERMLQQVRNLSLDLRPSLLDDLGLAAALRWYVDRQAQRAGFVAHIVADPLETRLPPDLETACFRVAQEALTNVVRHARARRIWVELRPRATELELVIRDDGVGFDVRAARERAARGASLGLLGMEERVRLAGGRVEIESEPTRGTELRARFPLRPSPSPKEQDERRDSP